jgi:hypothetical protein
LGLDIEFRHRPAGHCQSGVKNSALGAGVERRETEIQVVAGRYDHPVQRSDLAGFFCGSATTC